MDILSMFLIRQLFKSIVHIYFECTKCHTAGLDCHSTDSNDIIKHNYMKSAYIKLYKPSPWSEVPLTNYE